MARRIFFAVNVPEHIKEEIDATFLRELGKANKQGRVLKPVRKENLHITLGFMGYIDENGLEEIVRKIEKIKFREFEVELSRIGIFHDKVIWLGAEKGKAEIIELSKKINKALGLNEENIKAHLTLARNKELNAEKFRELFRKLSGKKFSKSFTAGSFHLMESRLSGQGPEYHSIKEFKATD